VITWKTRFLRLCLLIFLFAVTSFALELVFPDHFWIREVINITIGGSVGWFRGRYFFGSWVKRES